jgi:hypothetical protein
MKKQDGGTFENDAGGDGKSETIEDALALLKQGKQLEKEHKYWEATDKFIQGRNILQSLANHQSRVTQEERQIVSLYEEKSLEYLRQSRKTLLDAMTLEMEPNGKSSDFYENLTDEEAQLRIRLFYTLFSKKVDVEEPDKNVADQQWAIEERLQELNASLPSGFKTDNERMDSINRGLNRLGLSLYSQKKPFERFQEALPKDEDEQIEDIMAQAKDEVAFEKKFGGGTSAPAKTSNADADDFEDNDDDDEDEEEDTDEDLKLDDDQLVIKHIRQRVVKAQTKLAELVALLDEAKTAKDEEEKAVERYDDGSDDSIEKPSSDTFLESGKKKLRGAQRDLKKAMEEWNEALL